MPERMPALVKTETGSGHLDFREVPVPDIGADEVLIEIAYCGICGSDLHIEDGTHPCSPPVVLGHEFSGTVADVGRDVATVSVNDRVGFRHSWNPFPGVDADGGFAEYMKAPAEAIWELPDDVSLEAATQFETVRPPMTVVRDVAELDAGERVVVSGPGPMGLLVTSIARMEAPESIVMLGTEGDTARRLPKAAELGADETFVFGDEPLARIAEAPPDVWFETSGAPPAIEAAVDHVDRGGRVVCSGLGEGPWDVDMSRVAYKNLSIHGQWGGRDEHIPSAVDAMRSGDLDLSSIVTDILPLDSWREGFGMARSQAGIKILLEP